MTPNPSGGGGGNFGNLVYFYKNLLLHSGAWFRQTKSIVMMTKDRSTKIQNFMTPGAGFLILGHGNISEIQGMHYFF